MTTGVRRILERDLSRAWATRRAAVTQALAEFEAVVAEHDPTDRRWAGNNLTAVEAAVMKLAEAVSGARDACNEACKILRGGYHGTHIP